MKWVVDSSESSSNRRVEFKLVSGETVYRVSKFGAHSSRKNAIGTYAFPRWKVIKYSCLGQSFTSWAGVTEFLGDSEAVTRVKAGGSLYGFKS